MNRGRREARAEDDARVVTGMVGMITGIHLMKIYFSWWEAQTGIAKRRETCLETYLEADLRPILKISPRQQIVYVKGVDEDKLDRGRKDLVRSRQTTTTRETKIN